MSFQRMTTELYNTQTFSNVLLATQADAGGSGGGGGGGLQGPQGPGEGGGPNETIRIGLGAGETNQGFQGVAIGYNAGQTDQGTGSVALGGRASETNQGSYCLAAGYGAGRSNQGNLSVALGVAAGEVGQTTLSVAVGPVAGSTNQSEGGVAMGYVAGQRSQGIGSVAVGSYAGQFTQSNVAVAVGTLAGSTAQGFATVGVGTYAGGENQGDYSVGVGYEAARRSQGFASVAVGPRAGRDTQSAQTVAVGSEAGQTTQGLGSVAVGPSAGRVNQGSYAVAIGHRAGRDNQPSNSICINAAEDPFVPGGSGFYVKPIRQSPTANLGQNFIPVLYNPTTGEIVNSGLDFTQSDRLRIGYVGPQGTTGQASTNRRGIDIGATPAVANTAFIDFNSLDNGGNDFDSRIISIGGVQGTDGSAILQFQGGQYIFSGISASVLADNEYGWRATGTTVLPGGGGPTTPLLRQFGSNMRTYSITLAGATSAAMDFIYPNGRPMFGHYWFSGDCPDDANPGNYTYVTWELYLYRSGGTAGCKWEEVYARRQTNTNINIILPSQTAPGMNFQSQVSRVSKFFVQATLIDFS